MQKIQVEYQLTVSDYRASSYYGLVQRQKMAFRIMAGVIAVGILSLVFRESLPAKLGTLLPFLAGAYLIWGILLFAGVERGIRRYVKTPDCLIGRRYRATIDAQQIRFEIPERKVDVSFPVDELSFAFELSALFMLYVSEDKVFLLPKRSLSDAEVRSLRSLLQSRLKTRFISRFLRT